MRRRAAVLLALALVLGPAVAGAPSALPAAPHVSRTAVHLSDADALVAGATASRTGTAYAFSTVLSGKPVRWNPCRIIHWRFRTSGAPTGALPVVKAAVSRTARATGTTWVYDGPVTTAPTTAWLPTSAASVRPVLIGWTDGAHSDLLRNRPAGVLGVTRTAWFGRTVDGVSVAAIKAAVIALDRTDRLPLTGRGSWYTALLHELSHGMGLSHATSSRQLMYPVLQPGLTDLQSGDLQGLAKVGRPAGCLSI